MKEKLTVEKLIKEARFFCLKESKFQNKDLFGVTDGKAVGTYIEHKFQELLGKKYEYTIGSSARGIDFPGEEINTDLKVTSIVQPQSSCPFKNARQKIYGLGYNLLLFVYEKTDNAATQSAKLDFKSCSFIYKERTADYQTTKAILRMIENDANSDDIIAYLMDRNVPGDETVLNKIAEEILKNPPGLGYLIIPNALQWRLQYQRKVDLAGDVEGIVKIVDEDRLEQNRGKYLF
ncbi:MAG: restriction endonuclease [Candidatus Aminicenantes bacterium]|nr:restriction endonuclease [Candidatus Aminicenantes bacterium]